MIKEKYKFFDPTEGESDEEIYIFLLCIILYLMTKILLNIKNNLKWFILICLFIFSVVLWSVAIRENHRGLLKIVFLNVGQGDSIFIESPTGIQVLIDGGANKVLMKEISKILPWYDRHIDMILITHPDKDHFEGFLSLLEKYKLDVAMDSNVESKNDSYNFLLDKLKNKNIPKINARKGEVIDLGGGAYLQIIFPDRDVSGVETNTASIVAKLIYGETSVLLTGDSPTTIEDYLISADSEVLDSDILKLGHHGSRTSTSERFLSAVSPDYAIISAGKDNSYGHPHREVLEILEKQKVPFLGTYDLGRITFVSDGTEFLKK